MLKGYDKPEIKQNLTKDLRLFDTAPLKVRLAIDQQPFSAKRSISKSSFTTVEPH